MKHAFVLAQTLTSLLVLGAGSGCSGGSDSSGSDPGPDESAQMSSDESAALEESSDAVQSDVASTTVATLPVLPVSAPPASPAEATSAVMSNVGVVYKPAGCATATLSGATLTMEFNGCTGPYGMVGIDGEVSATFSAASSGGIDVAIESNALSLNGVSVQQSASAHVVWGDGTRTITWNGQYAGTTSKGKSFEHHGSYTFVLDSSSTCRTISGNGQTTVEGKNWVKSTLTNLEICGSSGACPKSGEVDLTFGNNATMQVDYLGNTHADVTGFLGHVYQVNLVSCTAS